MTWFDEIKRIRDEMLREFKEMFNDPLFKFDIQREERQPLVYGYSVYVGPDGVPIVKEFGNIKPQELMQQPRRQGRFDPYIDIIIDEKTKTLTVTAEIPGVDKKDISVSVMDNNLVIKSTTKGREFEKKIPLNAHIDAQSIKATYKNGILEITANVKETEDKKEFKVNIE